MPFTKTLTNTKTLFLALALLALSTLLYFQLSSHFTAQANTILTQVYTASQVVNEDGSLFTATGTQNNPHWIGTGATKGKSYLGLHFTGHQLPANATITSAKLEFTSRLQQWLPISAAIYTQNGEVAELFTPSSKPSLRPLSTTFVTISNNTLWQSNITYSFTNILKLAPSIASHKGSFAVIIKGTGKQFGRKMIYGLEDTKYLPRLVLTYTLPESMPAPTPSPTPTVQPSPTPTLPPIPSPSPSTHPDHDHNTNSHAMGLWNPTKWDTCPNPDDTTRIKEIHDSYFVYGPDGKKYPTWHPPVDPTTGCIFGHEHGRDPSTSALMPFITEYYGCQDHGVHCGIPFGYANESLDTYNMVSGITNGMRHEDHVGKKIEWENNVALKKNACDNPASSGCFDMIPIGTTCNFLMAPHQGTHSQDAFTNNMHELQYFVECNNTGPLAGTKVAITKMTIFGTAGDFFDGTVDQGGKEIAVGSATPVNSPSNQNSARSIPTIGKVREHILVTSGKWSQYSLGLYEDWISSNYITTVAGAELLYFDPHFAVFSPSRFYWPSQDSVQGVTRTESDKQNNIGRSVDVCYMTENNGTEKFRGGECDILTNYGASMTPISYDDPRSPFNGVQREMYFNQTTITNTGGSSYWYTDPFGKNATAANPETELAKSLEAKGYIRQFIAPVNNRQEYALESQAIGGSRYYGGNGVHAPN